MLGRSIRTGCRWKNGKLGLEVLIMPTLVDADSLVDKLLEVEGKAEIINGKVVEFMPTGFEPGFAGDEIFAELRNYARQIGEGVAIGDNKGFLCDLPHRRSFSPDASYYTGPLSGKKFLPEPPIFAVEVRSENDYGRRAEESITAKIEDYFAAGTQVVWDVDLDHEPIIAKFTAPDTQNPQFFRRGEIADAEPAVPGWTLSVDALFPAAR